MEFSSESLQDLRRAVEGALARHSRRASLSKRTPKENEASEEKETSEETAGSAGFRGAVLDESALRLAAALDTSLSQLAPTCLGEKCVSSPVARGRAQSEECVKAF